MFVPAALPLEQRAVGVASVVCLPRIRSADCETPTPAATGVSCAGNIVLPVMLLVVPAVPPTIVEYLAFAKLSSHTDQRMTLLEPV